MREQRSNLMNNTTTHIDNKPSLRGTKQSPLVPELRFKEFDDQWKKSAIENHFEFKNGLNKEKEFFGYGTPIINFKDVYNLEGIKSNDIRGLVKLSDAEIKRYNALKGDVFFTRTSETIIDIGMAAALVEDIPNCVFSGFVLRARPIDNALIDDFKKFCFGTWSVRKEIVTKSSFTTRALTSGTLLYKVAFCFPKSHKEQQKIASFLSTVDEKIQQLTKKKELLEDYKKGVMQQLFSGKLRFVDEDGRDYPDWEEKRLGEIAKITTGSSNRQDSGLDGEFTFFDRSQDIRASSIFLFDGEAIIVAGEGQEFIPKYFIGKFDLHQRTYAIMDINHSISKFIFFYIYYHRHYFFRQAVGTTVKSLRLPMFTKMPIKLPIKAEQQKIATYLSHIDTKIEAINQQIAQTQTFKKGLLQQMFV